MQDRESKIKKAIQLIKEADYVLLGIGAGLSASAGLDYTDRTHFKQWFAPLKKRGFSIQYEALWYPNWSDEELWAVWSTHIFHMRYEAPAGKPYLDLYELIKIKDYFIITTNVDGQLEKAGFDKEKIFIPQGDYSFFQCKKPCSQRLWHNEQQINNMLRNMDYMNFQIRTQDVPRCPICGGDMEVNVRKGDNFVEQPYMKKQNNYLSFIQNSYDKRLLIMEFGVGFNTPVIIRFPFEKYTFVHPNANLIRVNSEYAFVSPEIEEKSICFSGDAGNIIWNLMAERNLKK